MVNKIKNVSELPDWFKIEKYKFDEGLDTLGWYEQLWIRGLFLMHAKDMRENDEVIPENFALAFQAICETPNVDTVNNQQILNYCTPSFAIYTLRQNKPYLFHPIKSVTMRDYINFHSLFLQDRLEYVDKWIDPSDPVDYMSRVPFNQAPWLDEPISNSFQPGINIYKDTIEIFLGLPDSFLIESFKQYLADKRKNISTYASKHFKETDFRNWSALKVLPFLDLEIWATLENIKISNRIFADALYPNGEKGEETIRKTTKQIAHSLITNQSLLQLTMQATADIAEKNHA